MLEPRGSAAGIIVKRVIRLGRQLVSYTAAGGVAFVADFGTLVFAVEYLGLHYLIAATGGFCVGAVVCYVLSLRWAFDEHRYASRTIEMGIFVAIGVVGVALNNSVMWGLVEFAHVSYAHSKFVAAGFVLLFNFAARRMILFSHGSPLPNRAREAPLGHPKHRPTVAG